MLLVQYFFFTFSFLFQMHSDFDNRREDRVDYELDEKIRLPAGKMAIVFLSVLFGLYGICYAFDYVKMSIPHVPKQYPYRGKTHYTFETESDN